MKSKLYFPTKKLVHAHCVYESLSLKPVVKTILYRKKVVALKGK